MRVARATPLLCGFPAAAAGGVPAVPLSNAADGGVAMPAVGLGTGGYGNDRAKAQGEYPECWSDGERDPYTGAAGGADCAAAVRNATETWLRAGGRRIDSSNSYQNMAAIGEAMAGSGVPRHDIFLTSKVGNWHAMGAKETRGQVDALLTAYRTDYIDLILIHWPDSSADSMDAECDRRGPAYDAKECRLSSWRALLELWRAGKARAVGVSNYHIAHIQEIADAGLPLPAVNQCPHNPHLAAPQADLLSFCHEHSIVFNAYSSLGIPDWHRYDSSVAAAESGLLLDAPDLRRVAERHGLSPAQALLAWQWGKGIVSNPRSMRADHMLENLSPAVFTAGALLGSDSAVLDAFPADRCSAVNRWYQCCGDVAVQASIPRCAPAVAAATPPAAPTPAPAPAPPPPEAGAPPRRKHVLHRHAPHLASVGAAALLVAAIMYVLWRRRNRPGRRGWWLLRAFSGSYVVDTGETYEHRPTRPCAPARSSSVKFVSAKQQKQQQEFGAVAAAAEGATASGGISPPHRLD